MPAVAVLVAPVQPAGGAEGRAEADAQLVLPLVAGGAKLAEGGGACDPGDPGAHGQAVGADAGLGREGRRVDAERTLGSHALERAADQRDARQRDAVLAGEEREVPPRADAAVAARGLPEAGVGVGGKQVVVGRDAEQVVGERLRSSSMTQAPRQINEDKSRYRMVSSVPGTGPASAARRGTRAPPARLLC